MMRYIVPSRRAGGASWPLFTPVEKVKATRRPPTLAVVIWSSALNWRAREILSWMHPARIRGSAVRDRGRRRGGG